jgi:hypothetical protein
MIQVIGEILPYAVRAAIGPSPIVVAVLLLFGARARVDAPSFLAGWAVGLVVAVVVVTLVASVVGARSGDPSTVAAWMKVAIGVLFLVLAFGQWRSRAKDDGAKEDPGWMRMFDEVNAVGAFGIGFTMTTVANPKNLALAGRQDSRSPRPGSARQKRLSPSSCSRASAPSRSRCRWRTASWAGSRHTARSRPGEPGSLSTTLP